MDCKEIQPVHSEGDQSWDFFKRNDAKAETKDSDAGRDWGQEEMDPKGNESCIFIGRTDAEAQIPILWPPDAKN